jgi:hypothetical protein
MLVIFGRYILFDGFRQGHGVRPSKRDEQDVAGKRLDPEQHGWEAQAYEVIAASNNNFREMLYSRNKLRLLDSELGRQSSILAELFG